MQAEILKKHKLLIQNKFALEINMLLNLLWCFCLVFDFVTFEQNYQSALEFVFTD